ncbi:MAG TPA: hypothetical protein VK506_11490 [Conexibacter sp.]|nr:hypothetical protein [Conexibacter sp.]
MLSRLAARALTGPLAFFVAGIVDVAAAWGAWAGRTLRARLARRIAR